MALPVPPINPNIRIPNDPFYYPETNYLKGEYGPFIVGSGFFIDNITGTISASGSGASLTVLAGAGILVTTGTGTATVTNTGVLNLVAGAGINISKAGGTYTISNAALPSGNGTVTQVNAGFGLTGGPITTSGTLSLATVSTIAPGTYTNPTIAVDSYGRITFATNGSATGFALEAAAPLQVTAGFPQTVSITPASTSAAGAVQLNDTVTSSSKTQAATARAVKETYDLANTAAASAANSLSTATSAATAANTAQITANNAQSAAAGAQATATAALADAATACALAAAAIPCASFTAAGQLLAGTGAGTYTALAPGSNGYVLSVNSACVGGLEWIASTPAGVSAITGTAPIAIGGTATNPIIGVDAASTSSAGVSRLATSAEVALGTSDTLAVTPLALAQNYMGCVGGTFTGGVCFDGGTVTCGTALFCDAVITCSTVDNHGTVTNHALVVNCADTVTCGTAYFCGDQVVAGDTTFCGNVTNCGTVTNCALVENCSTVCNYGTTYNIGCTISCGDSLFCGNVVNCGTVTNCALVTNCADTVTCGTAYFCGDQVVAGDTTFYGCVLFCNDVINCGTVTNCGFVVNCNTVTNCAIVVNCSDSYTYGTNYVCGDQVVGGNTTFCGTTTNCGTVINCSTVCNCGDTVNVGTVTNCGVFVNCNDVCNYGTTYNIGDTVTCGTALFCGNVVTCGTVTNCGDIYNCGTTYNVGDTVTCGTALFCGDMTTCGNVANNGTVTNYGDTALCGATTFYNTATFNCPSTFCQAISLCCTPILPAGVPLGCADCITYNNATSGLTATDVQAALDELALGNGTVTCVDTGTGLTGGPITSTGTIALADTAVAPGAYTYACFTVDQQGRLTAAGNGEVPVTCSAFSGQGDLVVGTALDTFGTLTVGSNGQVLTVDSTSPTGLAWMNVGSGTVTEVCTGTGLTGGPITTNGTIALANTTVTAGSYTYSTISVDAQGRLTAAASGDTPITCCDFNAKGDILIGTADNAFTALPVGTNEQYLIADSACASGVKWHTLPTFVTSITGTAPIQVDLTTPATPAISVDVATTAALGVVSVGSNISVDLAGEISVASASTSGAGIVQLYDGLDSTSTTEALTAAQGKALQDQIDALVLSGGLTYAGTLDANTAQVSTVTSSGSAAGFTIGSDLPAASATTENFFVVVTTPGTYTPPGGSAVSAGQGDWFLVGEISPGMYAWEFLNVGYDSPYATTTSSGVVQLSTDAATQAGTDANLAVTPSTLQSKISDSVSTTSSTTIASSTAVKDAYDLAAAAIPCSTITAVGDLVVGGAGPAPTALPVGTNGQVLVANSACASGLEWQNAGNGTVTSVSAGIGLNGGTITTSGTIDLANTTVTAGSYSFSTITVDAQGRLTAAADGSTPVLVDDFNAKGDILVGTADNAFTPLASGTNGQVLAVDTACASGLAWVNAGTGSVTNVATGTGLTGGPITNTGTIALANTAVTPGAYSLANITVDAQGRITAAANGSAVTSITAGTGLSGGTITGTGTVALANTAVTAGSYTYGSFTVDAQGRLTAASSGATPVLVSDFDAKGNLLVGTADNAFTALPVGTNGQVLTADSTCSGGVKWAAAGGGGGTSATPAAEGSLFGFTCCTVTAAFGNLAGCLLYSCQIAGNCITQCGTFLGKFAGTATLNPGVVAIGYQAACSLNQTALNTETIAIGNQAAATATGHGIFIGQCSGAVASGANTIAIGRFAANRSTAAGLIAIGCDAACCSLANGGCQSIAIGNRAMANAPTAFIAENVVVGNNAMSSLTNFAWGSVVVGHNAYCASLQGQYNVVIGYQAACGGCNLAQSVAIGCDVARNTQGGNNVFIGEKANCTTAGVRNNAIVIGSCAESSADFQVTLGRSGYTSYRIYAAGWTNASDARDKTDITALPVGLDFINTLNPVRYTWQHREPVENRDGTQEIGFIAQELKQAQDSAGIAEFAHLVDENDPEHLFINQTSLIPILVKAVQELSAEVAELKQQLADLQS